MTFGKSLSRPRVKKDTTTPGAANRQKREQLQCQHCEKRFTYPSELKKHTQRMHMKSHGCDQCEAEFDDYHALRNHKSQQHPRIYSCSWPGCNYEHRVFSQLKRHEEQSHRGEASVACSVVGCGAVFSYNRLAKHVLDAHGEERKISKTKSNYECPHCGAEKESRVKLKKHVDRVHGEKKEAKREKSYRCEEDGCGKTFSTPGALNDHRNRHRGVKPYECGRCSKQFHARASYAVHLRKYHATSIGEASKSLLLLHTFLGDNKKAGQKRSVDKLEGSDDDDEEEGISDDSDAEGDGSE